MNLLQLPATSAPTERSFKTNSRVHSKARNRTNTQRASKLAYVAFNLKTSILQKKTSKSEYDDGALEKKTFQDDLVDHEYQHNEEDGLDENSESDSSFESSSSRSSSSSE